jgi:c-di-GMP-related signal transduction protein
VKVGRRLPIQRLLPFAAFVKVDVLNLSKADLVVLAKRLAARGIPLVANRVDTREVFDWTRDAGCSLFQGRYVCQPHIVSGGAVAGHTTHLPVVGAQSAAPDDG